MSFRNKLYYSVLLFSVLSSCSLLTKKKSPDPVKDSSVVKRTSPDTSKTAAVPRLYKDVITTKAVSLHGLFTVHKVGQRYYFEIPDSLLGADLLSVNRVKKGASEGRIGDWGMAGDLIGSNVFQFSKGVDNKIFLKRVSFWDRSTDSSENGMYYNVLNSNLQPIVASFDVKAYAHDSSAVVIDMTDYLSMENDVFFFSVPLRRILQVLGTYQANKSYINKIEAFPGNIEIQTTKTFMKDDRSDLAFTIELNSSIVLLPKTAMRTRGYDARVGYFTNGFRNFDDPKGIKASYIITRWRLEPKEGDVQKYLRGELVTPKKPIIFYIDPTTPKKWVPYLIQGVTDWQKAFEKAGFKDAIHAYEAPKKDSSWSLEDANHSVIVFKPSEQQNASGPHISDPRTGEILEAHINLYFNVIQLIHDWYFIQTAPNDVRARSMLFSDSLMGQLLRFVCSHEVGHSLGLLHNFGASSTVPVQKLRDKDWVEKNGFCPSIMDYARFNYVAQPEDKITLKGLMPRIGVYDEWAIEWGYRWFPDTDNEQGERDRLSHWVTKATAKNPSLWFGNEKYTFDPRCQSEDLGDDAMTANTYGIENLKRVESNLISWTKDSSSDFESLLRMQNQLVVQYQRYMNHVLKYVSSVRFTRKTSSEQGPLWSFIERAKQKEAIDFFNRQLFNTPKWLVTPEVYSKVAGPGFYTIIDVQKQILSSILTSRNLNGLLWYQSNIPDQAYTPDELLNDLESGIFSELKTKMEIEFCRRNLQKVYVSLLIHLLKDDIEIGGFGGFTDLSSVVKEHIKRLTSLLSTSIPSYNTGLTKSHLADIKATLQNALLPFGGLPNLLKTGSGLSKAPVGTDFLPEWNITPPKLTDFKGDCWNEK